MSRTTRTIVLTISVLMGSAPFPRAAEARPAAKRPKVAVLEVRGWKGAHVRDVLTSAVAASAVLVPKQELQLASRRASRDDPLGVTKVLTAVGASLAVQGSVAEQGAAASTLVQVFARDGRRLAKWTGPGPGAKGGDAAIARGARQALDEALKKVAADPSLLADDARPKATLPSARGADGEPGSSGALASASVRARPARDMPALADAWSDPAPKLGWVDANKAAAASTAATTGPGATTLARSSAASAEGPATRAVPKDEAGEPAAQRPVPKDEADEPVRARPVPKDEVDEPVATAAVFVARRSAGATGEARAEPQLLSTRDARPAASTASATTFASTRERARPSGRAVVVPKDELVEAPSDARTVSALAGVTLRRRVAEVALDDGRTARHDTGLFPEVTVFARTRPFAASRSALAGVFADLEGAFAVGLSSAADAGTLSTSALRLSFGAGWLWSSDVLSLGPTVGFGLESFTLAENPVLGSSSYTWVRPGLLARVALAGEAFGAEVSGGYRAVVSAGELGAPYGQVASATGFDVGGRLGGSFDAISWSVGVTWERYALDFAAPKDSAPRVTAESGSDGSLLASAVLGVALR